MRSMLFYLFIEYVGKDGGVFIKTSSLHLSLSPLSLTSWSSSVCRRLAEHCNI